MRLKSKSKAIRHLQNNVSTCVKTYIVHIKQVNNTSNTYIYKV